MKTRIVLLFWMMAAVLVAWAPPRDAADWVQQTFAHRCRDVEQSPGGLVVHCAANGSVGALEAPYDFHISRQLHADTVLLSEAEPRNGGYSRGVSLSVMVSGEFLVINHMTCGRCVRVMGRTWILRVASAPDGVLRAAQASAGLPAQPLLRTVEAWRTALAARSTAADAGTP